MKKFKQDRASVGFEYEFKDGTSAKFEYVEPNSKQIEEMVEVSEKGKTSKVLKLARKQLRENLRGDESAIDKMMDEFMQNGNIFKDLKEPLDEMVGKQKKSRKSA